MSERTLARIDRKIHEARASISTERTYPMTAAEWTYFTGCVERLHQLLEERRLLLAQRGADR